MILASQWCAANQLRLKVNSALPNIVSDEAEEEACGGFWPMGSTPVAPFQFITPFVKL